MNLSRNVIAGKVDYQVVSHTRHSQIPYRTRIGVHVICVLLGVCVCVYQSWEDIEYNIEFSGLEALAKCLARESASIECLDLSHCSLGLAEEENHSLTDEEGEEGEEDEDTRCALEVFLNKNMAQVGSAPSRRYGALSIGFLQGLRNLHQRHFEDTQPLLFYHLSCTRCTCPCNVVISDK